MTKIKLCGLTRPCDIDAANECQPEYIGFVFAKKSRRYVSPEAAAALKERLSPGIKAVGVFVNEDPEAVAGLLNCGIIDIAQLHGSEDEDYLRRLRLLTTAPLIQAFRIDSERDIAAAQNSSADYVLLDSGSGGTGTTFDWKWIQKITRPYFLAGGLGIHNVTEAVLTLRPYGVDVSSFIETDGRKDSAKMKEFVRTVRSAEGKDRIE